MSAPSPDPKTVENLCHIVDAYKRALVETTLCEIFNRGVPKQAKMIPVREIGADGKINAQYYGISNVLVKGAVALVKPQLDEAQEILVGLVSPEVSQETVDRANKRIVPLYNDLAQRQAKQPDINFEHHKTPRPAGWPELDIWEEYVIEELVWNYPDASGLRYRRELKRT